MYTEREKTINPLWIWAQFYRQTPNSSLNKNKKEINVVYYFVFFIQSSHPHQISVLYLLLFFFVKICISYILHTPEYLFSLRTFWICTMTMKMMVVIGVKKWKNLCEDTKKKGKPRASQRDREQKKESNIIQYEISTRLGRTLAKSCN